MTPRTSARNPLRQPKADEEVELDVRTAADAKYVVMRRNRHALRVAGCDSPARFLQRLVRVKLASCSGLRSPSLPLPAEE
ncbi:hypothetical protein AB5N19_12114 [Seiridium cardinale]